MTLIDGKATATAIKAEIAEEVKDMVAKGGRAPHLVAILVGHDGGSETYVRNKVIACEACGFKSTLVRYEDDVTEEELLAKVKELNEDEGVDGFIVQLPLCLQADLEITDRINHGFLPTYIDPGMDATVSWGRPDYKFRNSSSFPIQLKAQTTEDKVIFVIMVIVLG